MLYTCCNFQRNNCQRTCCGGNAVTTTNTATNNGCCGFFPANGIYGVFIPFTGRRCYMTPTPYTGCVNATTTTNGGSTNTTSTTNGCCGGCNLCTTGTMTTPINGDLYYARQYGLYTNCGCGY